MEQGKVAKQMIDFHKATFDNTFNTISILQEQTVSMVNLFLKQSNWLPDEGRKVINEWVKSYKTGLSGLKTSADDSFEKVEDFFATFNKDKTINKAK